MYPAPGTKFVSPEEVEKMPDETLKQILELEQRAPMGIN